MQNKIIEFLIFTQILSQCQCCKNLTKINFKLRVMRNVCPIISCVCFIINRSSKFDVYYANIGNECENVQEKERAVYLDICTHILICQSKVIDPITYFCINYWIFSLWEH